MWAGLTFLENGLQPSWPWGLQRGLGLEFVFVRDATFGQLMPLVRDATFGQLLPPVASQPVTPQHNVLQIRNRDLHGPVGSIRENPST